MADHLASLGSLGFTYRTCRPADRLTDGGRRLYESLEVPVDPDWHASLPYIGRHGPVPVTQAATALRVSHPAVIDMARRMEAKGRRHVCLRARHR